MKSKASILVVENDGIIAKDLEKTLGKFGYSVIALAFSGEEALSNIAEHRPDLVITETVLTMHPAIASGPAD